MKVRRCGYCKQKLSDWNDNDFCWAHLTKGQAMEREEKGEKAFETYRKKKNAVINKKKRER